MKKIYITIILLMIFSVTLIFRLQFINNQSHCLDDNHIYMLTTLSVWEKEGALNHKFSPVITFTNPGDKFVSIYKRLEDKKGNNYYVSYPPFTFIAAYPLLKLVGFENGKIALQIANLLLHLVSCFFVYLIVLYYFDKKYENLFVPAVFAYAVYCFSPVVLYLHTDIFFPEMFSQFLYLIVVLFTMIALRKAHIQKTLNLFLLGIIIFCFVYTEWIGIFYSLIVGFILYHNREKSGYIKILKTFILASFAALSVTLVQYSLINGFKSMLRSFLIRFIDRSGYFTGRFSESTENAYNFSSYILYVKNVFNGLWGLGILITIVLIIWFISQKGKIDFRRLGRNNLILIITLPVIIYSVIFFNATMLHYHLVAKMIIPVSIFSGLLINRVFYPLNYFRRLMLYLFSLIFIITVSFSMLHYRDYEKFLISFTDRKNINKTANFINENAEKDDVIFLNLKSENPSPILYLGFLTKRNMAYTNSLNESDEKFKLLPQQKAIYFEIDERTGKMNYIRINKQ